jgi:hypothetical protein
LDPRKDMLLASKLPKKIMKFSPENAITTLKCASTRATLRELLAVSYHFLILMPWHKG